MTRTIHKDQLQKVVARFFYLAWKACGKPAGFGTLQDKPDASEEDVLVRALNGHDSFAAADYPTFNTSDSAYSDYCFGRCMKTGIEWTFLTPLEDGKVELHVSDNEPRRTYQCWYPTYKTYAELLEAALKELKVT